VLLDSTDTNFVCWSPPLRERGEPVNEHASTMNVGVSMMVTSATGEIARAVCVTPPCQFRYDVEMTPIITYASLGGYPGSVLHTYGNLRAADVAQFWARTGGDVRGGGVGGALCNVHPPMQIGTQGTGGPNRISDNPSEAWWRTGGSWGGTGILMCRLGAANASSEAGRYAYFQEPRDNGPGANGFGQPLFSVWASQNPALLTTTPPSGGAVQPATLAGMGFGVTIRPLISTVSVSVLGTAGGALVSIKGAGFSSAGNNQVMLGDEDVPCTITRASARELECVAGPAATSSPLARTGVFYPGGAGLLRTAYVSAAMPSKVLQDTFNSWKNTIRSRHDNYPRVRTVNGTMPALPLPALPAGVPPTFAAVNADALTSRVPHYGGSALEDYVEVQEGYFVPPVSANYTFFVRGDDGVSVFLSNSSDPAFLAPVAVSPWWNNNWWTRLPAVQISSKIWADAGVPRYFKTVFVEGGGADWYDVAIRVHSENGTNAAVVNTLMSDPQRTARGAWTVQRFVIQGTSGTFIAGMDWGLGGGQVNTTTVAIDGDDPAAAWRVAVLAAATTANVPLTVHTTWIAPDAGATSWFPAALDSTNGMLVLNADLNTDTGFANWVVAFWGPIVGSMKPLVIYTDHILNAVAPANVTATVTVLEDGSGEAGPDPFYWPAPMDFFRSALPLPAVRVTSNGLLGVCQHVTPYNYTAANAALRYNVPGFEGTFTAASVSFGNWSRVADLNGCAAVYDARLTPTVWSVSTYDDNTTLYAGAVLTINGTGFLSAADGIGAGQGGLNLSVADMHTVTLNGSASGVNATFACTVTAAHRTHLACTVPDMAVATYAVSVSVGLGRGDAVEMAPLTLFQFEPTAASVSPSSGSRAGGTLIVISGSGFSPVTAENVVTVGGWPCDVVDATPRNIMCITPPTDDAANTETAIASGPAIVEAELRVNGALVQGGFKYAAARTPLLSAFAPVLASSAVTATLNLTVSNVDLSSVAVRASSTNGLNATVTVGGRECAIATIATDPDGLNATATLRVTCVLTRRDTAPMPQAPEEIRVQLRGLGFAAVDAQAAPTGGWRLDSGFRVTGISPAVGSLAGGTLVTLTGVGFTGSAGATSVSFMTPSVFPGQPPHNIGCSVRDIAPDGTWMTCVTSRPDYEGVYEFIQTAKAHAYYEAAWANFTAGTWQPSPSPSPTPSASIAPAGNSSSGGGGADSTPDPAASPSATPSATASPSFTPSSTASPSASAAPAPLVFTEPGAVLLGELVVVVNRFTAACQMPDGSCAFSYASTHTPAITGVTYFAGNRTARLVGRALQEPLAVWFGAVAADVLTNVTTDLFTSASTVDTSIPHQAAGMTSLYAHTGALGNVYNAWRWQYNNTLHVASVVATFADATVTAPLNGSYAGGHSLSITGTGFSPTLARNVVKLNTMPCIVQAASPTSLTVLTPAQPANAAGPSRVTNVSVAVLAPNTTAGALASLSTPIQYKYVLATSTPTLTSVVPATTAPGTLLQLVGTNFGPAGAAGSKVTVANTDCDVVAWSGSYVNCTLSAAAAAGTHVVQVWVGSLGQARVAAGVALTVPLLVTAATPLTSGAGGGATITISGTGFATSAQGGANAVTICGVAAPVVSSTPTSLTLLSPELPTVAANDAHNTYLHTVLKGSAAGSASVAAAFDGDPTTPFTACSVTVDMGAYLRATVTRLRFYPKMNDYAVFANSLFRGAVNSSTGPWETVWTAPPLTSIMDGWNYIDLGLNGASLAGAPRYQYLRWDAAPGSSCTAMELEWVGKPFVVDGATCPVAVSVVTPATDFTAAAYANTSLATNFTVSTAATPVITDISPAIGTALGGELIALTGAGFAPGVQSIVLNGMPCTGVVTVSDSFATCISGVRTEIQRESVLFTVAGSGRALVNDTTTTFFSYLDRWSARNTWLDDEPPGEGDTVVVPAGQAVLVDVSPPPLFLVMVLGRMVFDKTVPELAFDANYILVMGGKLEIGTEAEPYLNKLTITLHGERQTAVEVPGLGAKVLGAMNAMPDGGDPPVPLTDPGAVEQMSALMDMAALMGDEFGLSLGAYGAYPAHGMAMTMDPVNMMLAMSAAASPGEATPYNKLGVIDIHGAPRTRVWTFGGAPAPQGSTIVITREDVDWQPGEHIVVSPTGYQAGEAEERIIVAVNGPRNVTVDAPFAHTHDCFTYASSEYGFSDTLICFEVGLLSRNVVLQGDEASTAEQFGMHTMAAMGAVFRLQDAELRRCGQSLVVGRYCAHYHLCTDQGGGSYARSNSFHDSFQRAVTIHATNDLVVADNVAYHIMAHSFFIEDGKWVGGCQWVRGWKGAHARLGSVVQPPT
jgi:hypothetical protein